MSFGTIPLLPVKISAQTDEGTIALDRGGDAWGDAASGVSVSLRSDSGTLAVEVRSPKAGLRFVHLRWAEASPEQARYLGDHWERGYGDLEWRGLVPERVMPWYFLRLSEAGTRGLGVKTGASSIAHWQVDAEGISLWLDVRSGGVPVKLGQRALVAAKIVQLDAPKGESAFSAATRLCKLMCDRPLMPAEPVYGGNNWYYAYGNSSHDEILKDAEFVASSAPAGAKNRPFMVIDDGWQIEHGSFNGGPWDRGNARFPDMPRLAREMADRGTRPGIWLRPLFTRADVPEAWRFPKERFNNLFHDPILDPSRPEVVAHVAADIKRLVDWGYELIKHDFTTYDICGLWGMNMRHRITADGWSFADQTRTTAEIILDLYRAIREAAGSALVIGCNTVGHLAAGLVEIQRTGDDTSGREWERTRKMGVNTLAFRMPQHGTFFAVDADCAGLTDKVPWHLNRQWLHLLAASGTPLFVSADPKFNGPDQQAAMREAFALASVARPHAEPLDWLDTTCPSSWKLDSGVKTYRWSAHA